MAIAVAIIGGGGTGLTLAAHLSLAGFESRLYEEPEHGDLIKPVSERGGVEITGVEERFGKVHKVTTDIKEALKEAKLIFVSVLAPRHERIAELCAPALEEGQTIVLAPGNAGSVVFANVLRRLGTKKDVVIGDLQANFFSCRRRGPTVVFTASTSSRPNFGAAFPAKNTKRLIERLEGIFECRPATNVLEVCLNNSNLIGHLGPSILNATSIEQQGERFCLHDPKNETPAVKMIVEAVNWERVAVLGVLGWKDRWLRKLPEAQRTLTSPLFQSLEGPSGMTHRYISEDASTACSLMVSLGEMVGSPTPVTKALISVASAINQTDYYQRGRTVERLGISGMAVRTLNEYLQDGQ